MNETPSGDSGTVGAPHAFEPIGSDQHPMASDGGSPSSNRTAMVVLVMVTILLLVGGSAVLIVSSGDSTDGDAAIDQGSDDDDDDDEGARTTDVSESDPVEAVPVDTVAEATVEAIEPPTTPAPPTTLPSETTSTLVSTTTTTVPSQPAPAPASVGPPTVAATVQRPPSVDGCDNANTITYPPTNVTDGLDSTAWMAPGDGSGQSITFTYPETVTVSAVGLFPGYGKIDPCTGVDRFGQLRTVTSVRWQFDDGTAVNQLFTGVRSLQSQAVTPVETRTVTMTILATALPGFAQLDNTPISEMFIG